ncbi:MAG: TRAP transporter large permease [Spirochaetales bacterium]|nr:TRAP transporter large permease [Spirochaetales bacterium]
MIYGFLILLFILFCLGTPIVTSLIASAFSYGFFTGRFHFTGIIPERLFTGMTSFSMLAIPLFVLSAEIMNKSGITSSLVQFSLIIMGKKKGGLAQVNTSVNVMFAALCGSAAASVSAIGKMLIPAMEENGYDREQATAVTVASAIIGTVIPPSILMIIYGFIMQVSVGALFAGGILPGLFLGALLMLYNSYYARKNNIPVHKQKYSIRDFLLALKEASWALATPVIILGSIFSGMATATEAAALTVLYTLIVGLFIKKSIKLSDIVPICIDAAKTTSQLLLLVGSAIAFSWVMGLSQIPANLSRNIVAFFPNALSLFLIFNITMLILGMFVDATATVLISGPIFVPALVAMGVHPVHIGIVFVVNLSIGAITPPFGSCLFVGSRIGQVRFEALIKRVLPFLGIHLFSLLIITYVPVLSLWLPRLLGLTN